MGSRYRPMPVGFVGLAATMLVAGSMLAGAVGTVAEAKGPAAGTPHPANTTLKLTMRGTTRIAAGATAAVGSDSYGAATELSPAGATREQSPRSSSGASSALSSAPNPATVPVVSSSAGFTGFNGLSHVDTRLASGGNQFSLEPPDQGLCVGNGYVVETINDVMAVYGTSGNLKSGPTALNAFYKYPVAVDRSLLDKTPGKYGPSIADPKCLYDAQVDRFFMTVLTFDTDSTTGLDSGTSHIDLAVSKSGDPTGLWTVFSFSTTNAGGSDPADLGCPCFGDQPLLGADANGIYVSTNEFPIFNAGFNGAKLYAISKSALAAAAISATPTIPRVAYLDLGKTPTGDAGGSIWYSVQPATSPSAAQFDSSNNGTEYFLSSLDFFGAGDHRIAAWSLTNTASLASTPAVTMQPPVILSTNQWYAAPLDFGVAQQGGPRPLASYFAQAHGTPIASIEKLNANDDRMNQVVYSNHQLWAGVNTAAKLPDSSAIAYFVVHAGGATFAPTVAGGGYVAIDQGSVLFPSIGVNDAGQAVMAFSVSSRSMYPSTGYASVTTSGPGAVHIAGAGAQTDDGFTAYAAYGGNGIARWGDYSAAVADSSGNIWIAAEYIPGGARTLLANWGTYVSHVAP
jgi:hypothetical protein